MALMLHVVAVCPCFVPTPDIALRCIALRCIAGVRFVVPPLPSRTPRTTSTASCSTATRRLICRMTRKLWSVSLPPLTPRRWRAPRCSTRRPSPINSGASRTKTTSPTRMRTFLSQRTRTWRRPLLCIICRRNRWCCPPKTVRMCFAYVTPDRADRVRSSRGQSLRKRPCLTPCLIPT